MPEQFSLDLSGDASSVAVTPGWLSYVSGPESDDVSAVRDLDVALGRFLYRAGHRTSESALRLAVLCSVRLGQGHPCLDLAALCAQGAELVPDIWRMGGSQVRPAWLPATIEECCAILDEASFVGDGSGGEPLVRHGHRLYLARYWRAGVRIRAGLSARLEELLTDEAEVPRARQWLERVFPQPSADAIDWQRIACANALLQRFSIITGGPGTGKTTTVVQLLAVLQGLAQASGSAAGLRVRLAAPTGKAAARLNESIAGALATLYEGADAALSAALDAIPRQVVTLHRLLGSRPDTRRLTYHAGHPLDLDVLVVDEASMMDVEMTDAVLAALPLHARLVLLGDKDQLASVEAGAVLGELCARAEQGHYRLARCVRLQALCGQAPPAASTSEPGYRDEAGTALDQAVVMLRVSHRFDARSGIGRLARAINAGDVTAVGTLCDSAPRGLRVIRPQAGGAWRVAPQWLSQCGVLARTGYPALFGLLDARRLPASSAQPQAWDDWAAAVLVRQARLQVLCALRRGPWGVEQINRMVEAGLRAQGCIASGGAWYAGRPVLVTRNQPALGLANGDIGVVLRIPDRQHAGQWVLRVAFAGDAPGRIRWVTPARLSSVETVYALTVHKSQGSEFRRVVLVLPDHPSPLLTRELLYTGVTRARQSLVLVAPGTPALLAGAVRRATRRSGGIWDPDAGDLQDGM